MDSAKKSTSEQLMRLRSPRAKCEERTAALIRREPQCLVVLLHPDVCLVADPFVDGDHHYHAAGGGKGRPTVALRHGRAINVMALDDAPFTARSPILDEVIVGVPRILFGMLFPAGVVHPDAVRLLEVLLLQCVEELVDDVLLRPEAEAPPHQPDDDRGADGGDDP